ncbi:MAG: ribonuclease J, partial [Clostridia bacterium]|nr:ribonuclease J [Clostridia bacterium]
MANKNFLSSSVTINDINKNKEKKSIKDIQTTFVFNEKPVIDSSKVRVLEPDFVIKEKPQKKKIHSSQGVITRTVTNKEKHEIKEEPMKKESDIQILTPKVSKTTKNQVRNNHLKFQNYGQQRKIVDDFDFYTQDEYSYDDYEFMDGYDYKELYGRKKKSTNSLKVIFLGGVGEIGKNMTAVEYGSEIVLIDCGSSFPTEDQMGVDLIVPDITYLNENASKVKAILITHGHEDHIGAITYLTSKINAPIYGSKLSIGLIKNKLPMKDVNFKIPQFVYVDDPKSDTSDIKRIDSTETKYSFEIGKHFKVEFVPVCHSIPGSMSIFIQTTQASLFHSGDFKIDFTPIGKVKTDLARMAEIGKKGVDLLLCESTNIDREGFSMSEQNVGKTFEDIFKKHAKKRLIVSTFASNISRIQQIITLCEKYNRKVAFFGRSMVTVTDIASSDMIKELKYNKNNVIEIESINNYRDENLLILCTGSQGEENSALTKMAEERSNKVNLGENDTVIISASAIPGNEKSINNTINNLFKIGCDVIYSELADVHVSGHACQEEIKTIHELIKPKYFIPIHGEYRHLRHHKELAINMGIKEENIAICEIGDCVKITKTGMTKLDPVPSGMLLVDGLSIGDSDSHVLKERSILSNDGVCVIAFRYSRATKEIQEEGFEIITKGFAYQDEKDILLRDVKQMLMEKINGMYYTTVELRPLIKKEIQNYFVKIIKRK